MKLSRQVVFSAAIVDGLAAPGLADETERLALQYVERDPRHGVNFQSRAPDGELDDEIVDAQEGVALATEMGLAGARHQAPPPATTDVGDA